MILHIAYHSVMGLNMLLKNHLSLYQSIWRLFDMASWARIDAWLITIAQGLSSERRTRYCTHGVTAVAAAKRQAHMNMWWWVGIFAHGSQAVVQTQEHAQYTCSDQLMGLKRCTRLTMAAALIKLTIIEGNYTHQIRHLYFSFSS